ncbi:hypothetical protein SDC9_91557 [bioreactor metagenome]|uniref:Uncharacterized protein n=1 Tax=bioreactor metagenome TaxID=1076179 RepID=A0A644ZVC1_9ZZZZ
MFQLDDSGSTSDTSLHSKSSLLYSAPAVLTAARPTATCCMDPSAARHSLFQSMRYQAVCMLSPPMRGHLCGSVTACQPVAGGNGLALACLPSSDFSGTGSMAISTDSTMGVHAPGDAVAAADCATAGTDSISAQPTMRQKMAAHRTTTPRRRNAIPPPSTAAFTRAIPWRALAARPKPAKTLPACGRCA